jgi:hypothetical protein
MARAQQPERMRRIDVPLQQIGHPVRTLGQYLIGVSWSGFYDNPKRV